MYIKQNKGDANIFIPFIANLNINGDCSSVAEHATVARGTGVRFSPFALEQSERIKKEDI